MYKHNIEFGGFLRRLLVAVCLLSSLATVQAQANGPFSIDLTIGLNSSEESPLPKGFEPFDEVEQFETGSFVVHLGTSFVSDINLETEDLLKNSLPALELLFEKAVAKNIGIGLKLGTKWWKADKIGYNYRYHSAALRATYHFNILDRLDPYLGVNAAGRYFGIGNGDQNVNNIKVTAGPVIGARYYLTDGMAGFAEFAEDGIGRIHFGLTFKLK